MANAARTTRGKDWRDVIAHLVTWTILALEWQEVMPRIAVRILIDPGSYHCGNVGDLAMLQAATERLRDRWPDASIFVVTSAPAALQRHCPGVLPVPLAGRIAFGTDRFFGRIDGLLPTRLSDSLATAERHVRHRWPRPLARVIAIKRAMAGRADSGAPRAYVDALRRADLVVVTGAGIFTDAFADNAAGVMSTLEFAAEWKIPTAVFGQGFGPVADETLRRHMARVLPRVDFIAVREERESVRLLDAVGVQRNRITVTGDDAIEMANRCTPAELGGAIGVNIRVASFAGVTGAAIDVIGPALHAAAARFDTALLPVPIAHHTDRSDVDAIQHVIDGDSNRASSMVESEAPAMAESEAPATIMAQVARCRIVVTGSYHAAVFALAQGIPAVAIVGSQYYRDKFSGLADLFAGGCEVVDIETPNLGEALAHKVERAWVHAERWREPLLRAARMQIERGKAAYSHLGTIVDARRAASRSRVHRLAPASGSGRDARSDPRLRRDAGPAVQPSGLQRKTTIRQTR